ncbi:hypothetical protein AVEN_78295-1 [Araneus ventricosus]|uniref:Uncharacterized protein n=1 Tax=Araneus ventricosus TaxID=182803 RepID=A0A4Y2X3Q8_ARAVE|nr:hypothetical protein AVEN_78295-1 [Araneus ventricosus]
MKRGRKLHLTIAQLDAKSLIAVYLVNIERINVVIESSSSKELMVKYSGKELMEYSSILKVLLFHYMKHSNHVDGNRGLSVVERREKNGAPAI